MNVIAATACIIALITGNPNPQSPDDQLKRYQAEIAAAEKSLRLGDNLEFGQWLDACDPTMRGWEWFYLQSIADTTTASVAMNDGLRRVISTHDQSRIYVIEDTTIRQVGEDGFQADRTIAAHSGVIYNAALSPDETRIATVSRDVTARVWDIETGKEIARLSLANPAVASTCFSPDGTRVATCAWRMNDERQVRGTVWIWNAENGDLIHQTDVGEKPLSCISYTPDGASIITASWDGIVHVLNPDGTEVRRMLMPDEGRYTAIDDLSVSADGTLVAVASKDHTIRIFNISTGDLIASLRGHGNHVTAVDFASTGHDLVSGSEDGTARLWTRRGDGTWDDGMALRGSPAAVRDVELVMNDTFITAACADDHLRTWPRETNPDAAWSWDTEQDGIYSCTLSFSANEMIICGYDGRVRVHWTRNGRIQQEWEAHPGSTCHAADLSADGRRVITCSWDKTARVWDLTNLNCIATLEVGSGVFAAAISADGRTAATSASSLQVWDIEENVVRHEVARADAQPRRVALSADGDLVLSAWSDGQVRIDRVSDQTCLGSWIATDAAAECVAFGASLDEIVAGYSDGTVRLFRLREDEPAWECTAGGQPINAVSVRHDRIALATDQVVIVDLASGATLLRLRPWSDTTWDVDWSVSGRELAAQRIGGDVIIMRARRMLY